MIGPTLKAGSRLLAGRKRGKSRADRKRNDVGDSMLRLTPPTITTFIISVILAAIAVAGQYIPEISDLVPISMFWLAVIAYVVLFVGNVIRGI
jgi:hypothetical protein